MLVVYIGLVLFFTGCTIFLLSGSKLTNGVDIPIISIMSFVVITIGIAILIIGILDISGIGKIVIEFFNFM